MDVMRGLGEGGGSGTWRAGVENLMLHFTPYSEDWAKLPVIVSGEGAYVTDERGNTYIDGLAGLFTTQVGHGREELAEVAAEQMRELGFFPNWSFQHPRSLELAHKIASIAPGDLNSTFFVSSGSEAVETVIKLSRQYHKANGEPGRYKVISRDVAYHGTTMGALSVTGLPAFKAPFEPLPGGFFHVSNTQQDPEGAAEAIERAIEAEGSDQVAAVILEPVQNAGGCLVPPPDYWKKVREICDRHGVLLVSDAVICAFGRLGEWFGIERFGVVPDMTSFAKGVTSGYLPMGGVVVSDRIANTLRERAQMFSHGSTFGGHPVSSAVALKNIEIIEREGLLGHVHDLEGHFGAELERMAEGHPIVREVRGMGFFWAVEIKPERADGTLLREEEYQKYFKGVLSRALLEGGLICRFDDKDEPVIQYSPALVSDQEVLSKIADITDRALTELERQLGYRS
ncbi:Adenosylmethionine-8-amino-7-oxononanoate aminotransferase [Rubrobacter radiotolerans]|uniref:Adenosylmethionine-8-amino-7-oxononanoate aminotransferase n=1 Tax=Rubrobacter radiotolerans TaxID=42256 RepID=A0A023WZY6_RUBRA|nr:aspartate aminotransferase family protein [Rubrobacter radiotolerans]AHY45623.1 Adenosylmethionine-8-amino-7-oxononanoate aminotransferase [Rubrobacter radiotolerans]MDX5893037.1 aspartate aminotransferase family protein [Rubrobacter radiotolerans]